MARLAIALLSALLASSVAAAGFELPAGPFPIHDSTANPPSYFDVEPLRFDAFGTTGMPCAPRGTSTFDRVPREPVSPSRDLDTPANREIPTDDPHARTIRSVERTQLLDYRASGRFAKYGEWLGKDAVNVFTSPLYWGETQVQTALLGTAGTVALFRLDEPVRDWLTDHPSTTRSDFLNGVRDVYGPSTLTLYSLAMFASGLGAGDEKLADAGFLALESLFFARLTSGALKNATHRQRPSHSENAFDFQGMSGSGTSSFVSMDTITAFAFASSVSEVYQRRWLTWTLYSLAGLVGLQRLDSEAHWLSDVTGAALLGHFIGRRTVGLHHPRDGDRGVGPRDRVLRNVRPGVAGDAAFVSVTIEF